MIQEKKLREGIKTITLRLFKIDSREKPKTMKNKLKRRSNHRT